jgi:hypothetical protein
MILVQCIGLSKLSDGHNPWLRRLGGRGLAMDGPYGSMMGNWGQMWQWMWQMQLVWVLPLVIAVAVVVFLLGMRRTGPKKPTIPHG